MTVPEPSDLPPVEPTWPTDEPFVAHPASPVNLGTGASRQRPAGIVALAVAIAAVLVAGMAAVSALTGPGANTPQDAVNGMLAAAGNSDVLGVLDHLAPAERDVLSGFLTDGVSDLKRLGVLSSDTDLHRIAGVSLSFDNVTTTTAALRDDLTAVTITGGTVHGHFDPARAPLGPFVHQQGRSALATAKVVDKTQPLHVTVPIMTVRDGATWYVSLAYTVAEVGRHRTGKPLPAVGVPALGAAGPTQAVDEFLRAAARLDPQRMIELTPPDEMAALHDYAPLLLPSLNESIAKLRAGPKAPTVTITDLVLTAKSHRGGQLVKLTKLGVRVTSGGTTVELVPGSKCLKVTSTDATPPVFPGQCGTHPPFQLWSSSSSSSCAGSPGGGSAGVVCPSGPSGPSAPNGPSAPLGANAAPSPYAGLKALADIHPDLGIVAVERGGRWYVSPLRTGLDDLEAVLHALTPAILQAVIKDSNPLSLLFLPLAVGARSTASLGAVSAPVQGGTPTPTFPLSPCVGGQRTITFPAPAGQPTAPPLVVPCGPPPTTP